VEDPRKRMLLILWNSSSPCGCVRGYLLCPSLAKSNATCLRLRFYGWWDVRFSSSLSRPRLISPSGPMAHRYAGATALTVTFSGAALFFRSQPVGVGCIKGEAPSTPRTTGLQVRRNNHIRSPLIYHRSHRGHAKGASCMDLGSVLEPRILGFFKYFNSSSMC
jgi:hypothetical protein